MNKGIKQIVKGKERSSVGLAERTSLKRFYGSCTGVKYPCAYHCKQCYFDSLYLNSN